MRKIILISLISLPLSIFSMQEQQPAQAPSRQPFVWTDLADSHALRADLQRYAGLSAALASGVCYSLYADHTYAFRKSLKAGLITGSFLAAWIAFFSPEFKAIRAEKKYQTICNAVETNRDLLEVNPKKAESLLRMHAESIHNLKKKLGRIKKQRYERNSFSNNLCISPRNQKFYTRCEELKSELAAAKKSLERGIFDIEHKNI